MQDPRVMYVARKVIWQKIVGIDKVQFKTNNILKELHTLTGTANHQKDGNQDPAHHINHGYKQLRLKQQMNNHHVPMINTTTKFLNNKNVFGFQIQKTDVGTTATRT